MREVVGHAPDKGLVIVREVGTLVLFLSVEQEESGNVMTAERAVVVQRHVII